MKQAIDKLVTDMFNLPMHCYMLTVAGHSVASNGLILCGYTPLALLGIAILVLPGILIMYHVNQLSSLKNE